MRASIFKLHRQFAWFAGIAAILWGLSGFAHPIMVWLSPKPVQFSAPDAPISMALAMSPKDIMERAYMEEAVEIRALSHQGRDVYLLRESTISPRRYFDPISGAELAGFDRERAEMLARHYTGETKAPILGSEYLTEFGKEYRDNNRLLPVWRVRFNRPDGLTAYVDTGSGRLATIDNKARNAFLGFFVNIHTLAYLPAEAEWVRVLIVITMVGSLFAAAILGIGVIFTLKARRKQERSRQWHRLIGYAAMIPALMFTASGLYHLLHSTTWGELGRVTHPPLPISADVLANDPSDYLLHVKEGRAVTGMTVVRGLGERPLVRLALAKAEGPGTRQGAHEHHGKPAHNLQKAPSSNTLWFDALTAKPLDGGAERVARHIAMEAAGVTDDRIESITPITRFTHEYGFLNKRLPVWRIALKGKSEERIFVDAADGVIASRIDRSDMRELTVFNNLHKWEFMRWLGQIPRDLISMLAVGLVIAASLFGWVMQIRRLCRTKSDGTADPIGNKEISRA